MRAKIIGIFSGILAVVALLTLFLVRATLVDALVQPAEQSLLVRRAVQAADAKLALEAAQMEKWLGLWAREESVRAVYSAGVISARQELASAEANRLRDAAAADLTVGKLAPSLVLLTDAIGVGLGRNGSELMRGDDFGKVYPALVQAISAGNVGSDLWVNQARQEQLLVSIAPVLGNQGERLGAIVLGVPLNDERLRAISEATSGQTLAVVMGDGKEPPIAVSTGVKLDPKSLGPVIHEAVSGAVSTGAAEGGLILAASPLHGYGYGAPKAVIVGATEATSGPGFDDLAWPILLAFGLGLTLVVICGIMLGNYISKPIEEIEEGLLLLINGHRDLRFDLEHDELGGLTSRMNALLNSLLGVDEGDPPPEHRPGDASSD
jgi:hypothetical protein